MEMAAGRLAREVSSISTMEPTRINILHPALFSPDRVFFSKTAVRSCEWIRTSMSETPTLVPNYTDSVGATPSSLMTASAPSATALDLVLLPSSSVAVRYISRWELDTMLPSSSTDATRRSTAKAMPSSTTAQLLLNPCLHSVRSLLQYAPT